MSARAALALRWLQALPAAALALWVLVLLRPIGYGSQWAWLARPDPPLPAPLAAAAGSMLLALLLAWPLSRSATCADTRARATRLGLAWRLVLALATTALPLLLYGSTPGGWSILLRSAVSDVSCEYLGEALEVDDPVAYCRAYSGHQQASAHHLATHPPGAVLAYRGAIVLARATGLDALATRVASRLCGRTAISLHAEMERLIAPRPFARSDVGLPLVVALLFALCGGLCVWPAAACGRRLWGEEAEFPAAALAATVPALALHFQNLDVPLALVSLLALWATLASLRSAGWGFAAGLLLAAGSFVSFGILAPAGLCVLVALLGRDDRDEEAAPRQIWARASGRAGAIVAAFAATWAGYVAFLGLDPLALAAASGAAHHGVMEGFQRAYSVWVWMNLVEFACFLGPPLLLLAAVATPAAVRAGGAARALGIAAPLVVLLLDLSGTVRAEVGRIWLPLMLPLAVLSAGAGKPSRLEETATWRAVWQATVILQLGVACALAAGIHPVVRPG